MKTGLAMALGAGSVLVFQAVVRNLKKLDEKSSNAPSLEEYVINNRADAEGALANLKAYSYKYENVSVADYYDLIGASTSYLDNNYGWTPKMLAKAKVKKTRYGWTIKLPQPIDITVA